MSVAPASESQRRWRDRLYTGRSRSQAMVHSMRDAVPQADYVLVRKCTDCNNVHIVLCSDGEPFAEAVLDDWLRHKLIAMLRAYLH
jgi:hypothetical protein